MITAVNFHLWEPCNMRCKFCFATFQDVKNTILPKGHLPEEEAVKVVEALADFGFEKITFAGGEPTLCKWLPRLIRTAKNRGLTTMIVTNGTHLTDSFLEENKNHLDWIALSVDSLQNQTNIDSGRAIIGKKAISRNEYVEIANRIKRFGYGFKINSVIHALNHQEDFCSFIELVNPERWKVFQVLPIVGQNDGKVDEFKISRQQFETFKKRHSKLDNLTQIVYENNSEMQGSYAMVDPAGRFYDNVDGKHNYSEKIIDAGVFEAIKQVNYSTEKFLNRGGLYDWKRDEKVFPSKITLSGEVASGKSTIGKLLAEKLNFEFVSIGNKTREYAHQQGMSIVDFQNRCLKNPEIDKQIDLQFSNDCNASEKLIIDYRLGFKFIGNAFHILLQISEETAIQRLTTANRINETHETVRERNNAFKAQFESSYGVDYTNPAHYDLSINVEDFDSPEHIVSRILSHFS